MWLSARELLAICAFTATSAIMVVVNLSHRSAVPKMPLMGDLIASSYMGRTNFDDRELQPYEAIIAKI